MQYNFFNTTSIKSIDDLKKQYFKLAKMYHPDRTGRNTNKEMAIINAEYESLFKNLKDVKYDSNDHTFKNSTSSTKETPQEFIKVIKELINIKDIEIMIIGSWLWVSGNTYPIKEKLKKLGFFYAKNKGCWYLHYDEYHKKSKSSLSLNQIMSIFGVKYVNSEKEDSKIKALGNKKKGK